MRNNTIVLWMLVILSLCTTVSAQTLIQPRQINMDWTNFTLNITDINIYNELNVSYLNVTIQGDIANLDVKTYANISELNVSKAADVETLWIKGNANISGHQFNSTTVSINGDLLISTGVIIQGIGQMSISNITSVTDLLIMPGGTLNITKNVIVGNVNISSDNITIGNTEIGSGSVNTTYLTGNLCPFGNCAITNVTTAYLENAGGDTTFTIKHYGATNAFLLQNFGPNIGLDVRQYTELNLGESAVYITTYVATPDSASLVFIIDQNTSSAGPTLAVRNQGSGPALLVGQNGPGVALDIDSESIRPPIIIRAPPKTPECNSTDGGGIYYNLSTNHFYGCNTTDWNVMDTGW